MLGPILYLIYISDIGEILSNDPLVYIDDTKAIKKIHNEDDVEKLQEDISKLHGWGKRNNMEFNNKKFVVLRYGKNLEIKENTSYFSGETDEIIEEKESTRDLGIIMQNDASFNEHTEKICKKVRQKSLYNRQGWFLRHMWNSLIQKHIDYCSQLWAPEERAAENIETLERLHSKNSRSIKNDILGEIEKVENELATKKK